MNHSDTMNVKLNTQTTVLPIATRASFFLLFCAVVANVQSGPPESEDGIASVSDLDLATQVVQDRVYCLSQPRPNLIGAESSSNGDLYQVKKSILKELFNQCYTKVSGYWTYEVCPFKTVKQYHQNGKGEAEGLKLLLGTYDKEHGTRAQTIGSWSFLQYYGEGKDERQALVTFECFRSDVARNPETRIASVQETQPLTYSLVIQTPLACEINCLFAVPLDVQAWHATDPSTSSFVLAEG